jgi:hypothetical protein
MNANSAYGLGLWVGSLDYKGYKFQIAGPYASSKKWTILILISLSLHVKFNYVTMYLVKGDTSVTID